MDEVTAVGIIVYAHYEISDATKLKYNWLFSANGGITPTNKVYKDWIRHSLVVL